MLILLRVAVRVTGSPVLVLRAIRSREWLTDALKNRDGFRKAGSAGERERD